MLQETETSQESKAESNGNDDDGEKAKDCNQDADKKKKSNSSGDDCGKESEFERRGAMLESKIDDCLNRAKTSLGRKYDDLQKFFDDQLQSCEKTLGEMSDNALDLKTSLMSAHQVKDVKKKRDLLDRLEACFDYGHWVELSFKPKRLDDCKFAMKDFVTMSFNNTRKLEDIM